MGEALTVSAVERVELKAGDLFVCDGGGLIIDGRPIHRGGVFMLMRIVNSSRRDRRTGKPVRKTIATAREYFGQGSLGGVVSLLVGGRSYTVWRGAMLTPYRLRRVAHDESPGPALRDDAGG